jgi:hypothetical protein
MKNGPGIGSESILKILSFGLVLNSGAAQTVAHNFYLIRISIMLNFVRLFFALSSVLNLYVCAQAGTEVEQKTYQQQKSLCLKNSQVELYINSSSLALLDIYDPINKISYVTEPGNPLFCITFIKSTKEIYETDRFISINGDQAKEKKFSISNSPNGKLLSLHYNKCPIDLIGNTINVTVEMELKDGSSLIHWSLKINGSLLFTGPSVNKVITEYQLHEVAFPTLAGLGSNLPASNTKDYVVLGVYSGMKIEQPREKPACGQGHTDYPGTGMQMLFYCDGLDVGGLYFAAEDPDGYRKTFVCTPMVSKKAFTLYLLHYGDGGYDKDKWELPYKVTCGPITGDWYDAAKIYRKWVLNARDIKPLYERNIPAWLADLAIMYEGQDRNPPEQLMQPTVDRLIRVRERLGVPIGFHWYLWHKDKRQDHRYPDYFPAQPGFKEAIEQLAEKEIFAMPYMNVEVFDMLAGIWTTENAAPWASRDENGNFNKVLDWEHNDYENVNMCVSTEYWQNKIFDCIEKLYRDYNSPAVYLDEIPANFACFAKNHSHKQHGGNYITKGTRSFLKRVRQKYPNIVLSGEHLQEEYVDLIDLQLPWADVSPESIPMFQTVFSDCTLEMGLDFYNQDLAVESLASKFGFMFVRGRQFWICEDYLDLSGNDYEEQVQIIKKMAVAKREAKKFLGFGEFLREPVISNNPTRQVTWMPFGGTPVQTEPIPYIWSGCYEAPDKNIGIVLFNTTDQEQEVEVVVNFKDWHLTAEKSKIVREYSNGTWNTKYEAVLTQIQTTIAPYSPAILEITP